MGDMGDMGDIRGSETSTRAGNDSSVWNLNRTKSNQSERARRKSIHIRKWWRFKMRGFDDDGERDWWFASTAIPLLASAIAPLANVVSIAALVTYWRMDISDGNGGVVGELEGRPFKDPRWAFWLNVASLVCGFVGNIFLLFNFTSRVRYIIALPATIILWCVATFILTGITISMHLYQPPVAPFQVYTQGYWYAVMAAVLYFICSVLLMFNMLGYFLGHYPQQFDLTDHQRTLILQTMLFFVWLAGGGAVFSTVETDFGNDPQTWAFVDGLYFCDVTILTVGFGDLYPHGDLGRGLVFPYSVLGIIMLGLVITSISKFASELSEDKIIRRHRDNERNRTVERSITSGEELRKLESRLDARPTALGRHIRISEPFNPRELHVAHSNVQRLSLSGRRPSASVIPSVRRRTYLPDVLKRKEQTFLVLCNEKDRFDAMKAIQHSTQRFRRWYSLSMSIIAFGILWCVGAVVFWQLEKDAQGMTYYRALYFCYVCLLTIGYGDLAPKSNAGRCFFFIWSLVAVPTMTILVNDLGRTVIDKFKKGTFRFADFTILPKEGVYRDWIESKPRLFGFLKSRQEQKQKERRMKEGIPFPDEAQSQPADDPDVNSLHPNLETLTNELTDDLEPEGRDHAVLARHLAVAIRSVASDLKSSEKKHYTFEEWAEFMRLIRFTGEPSEGAVPNESQGVFEWDWIGPKSPMMSDLSEPEFVLDHLCESLGRYMKTAERKVKV
ncbi:voltage-gated potassium channel [Venturia nashicola]|uniref:Voltage-gated potassium channel n=1 Tax=Venturia nashicola TaxID=86259 RepID=A0A4Z1PL46_9PEZI|nr:voltage-gated potassium channel [Venturia nashicola]TLD38659.1 voltage-gated potassium channel [Venturia nashicola]